MSAPHSVYELPGVATLFQKSSFCPDIYDHQRTAHIDLAFLEGMSTLMGQIVHSIRRPFSDDVSSYMHTHTEREAAAASNLSAKILLSSSLLGSSSSTSVLFSPTVRIESLCPPLRPVGSSWHGLDLLIRGHVARAAKYRTHTFFLGVEFGNLLALYNNSVLFIFFISL